MDYITATMKVTDKIDISMVLVAQTYVEVQVPNVRDTLGLPEGKYCFVQRRMDRLVR